MQSPFPRRDGRWEGERARASYTLGLAAICACSPWLWGHVAPSGTVRSGAPVGERAALRRAWRGVAWGGARGREVAQVVVLGGAVGRFGAACTPFARLRRRAQNPVGDTFRYVYRYGRWRE